MQAAFGHLQGCELYRALVHHFETFGAKEGRSSSAMINFKDYLHRYGDLVDAFGTDPTIAYAKAAIHYYANGLREGRSAAPS